MPLSAIENVEVDYVLPVREIAPLLAQLAQEKVLIEYEPVPDELEYEADIAELDMAAIDGNGRPGKPSRYACPECGGALWEIQDGDLFRFRCRVGHAFSAQTLLAEQTNQLEEALWVALRALEESQSLAKRMAERAHQRGHHRAAERFEEQSQNTGQRARIIRDVLLNGMLGGMAAVADRDEDVDLAHNSEGD
jgi:two-component system chemotaxis response regulator CheB